MNNKVLVVGIDGGAWTILRWGIDHGFLPFLSTLVNDGASGILQSTIPANTPTAWTTFQTGLNPGHTGVFHFSYWDRTDRKSHLVSASLLPTTLWEHLGNAGKSVGVLNVPMTYPPRPVNGFMVTGLLTPSDNVNFTYPPQLQQELLRHVPDYHIFQVGCAHVGMPHEHFEDYVNDLARSLDQRQRAADFLIARQPLDVFMIHFQATDVVQHVLWDYLDESQTLFTPEKRRFIFERFYRRLDNHIAAIRDAFARKNPGPCLTLIISDHGFQKHRKIFNLANWLADIGFLRLNRVRLWAESALRCAERLALDKLLNKLRHPDSFHKQRLKVVTRLELINWKHTRALPIFKGGEGMIYLVEDDPNARRRTARELTEKILKLIDPADGQPLAQAVYPRDELFHGPVIELLPDLIIQPRPGYSFNGDYEAHAPLLRPVRPHPDRHIGAHHRDGVIIAAGQNVKPQNGLVAQIADIAPTILSYLNLPVSQNMDGRNLAELFLETSPSTTTTTPPTATSTLPDMPQDPYSPAEQEQIRQHLRDLGYL